MINFTNEYGDFNIEIDAYRLGEQFAGMDNNDQVRFLKGFISEVHGENMNSWSMQCRYITDNFQYGPMKSNLISALEDLIDHLKDNS